MQYAPHDSNPKSSLTPSHLHMPSVKNRQGLPALDYFSKTKAFCFVILDTLDTPNGYLFPYPVLCVMHLWATNFRVLTAGRRTLVQHFFRDFTDGFMSKPYTSFSPKGVSIPTCFTHLHTYFSCHATVSLNLDIVPFY